MKPVINILILFVVIFLWSCEPKKITGGHEPETKKVSFGLDFDRKYWGNWYEDQSVQNIKDRMTIFASHKGEMVTLYRVLYLDGLDANSFTLQFPSENPGWKNYSVQDLSELARFARGLGLQVQLAIDVLPIVYGNGWYNGYKEEWRGRITPSNPSMWFNNFNYQITQMSQFAQDNNIEILNLGQELVSMSSSEYTSNWQNVVSSAREVYSGQLSYYFNGGIYDKNSHSFPLCEYVGNNTFCSLFDILGITMYPNLSDERIPSVDSLQTELKFVANFLEEIHSQTGKPIMIGETSCPCVEFPLTQNYICWAWSAMDLNGKTHCEEAQANYCQALINVFSDKEWFEGLFWHNSYNNLDNPDNGIMIDNGPSPFGDGLAPKQMLEVVKNSFN